MSTFNVDYRLLDINILKQKLYLARLPETEPATNTTTWEYGTRKETLQSLIDYWKDEYDFEGDVKEINERVQQFTADLDGQTVHFLHHKATPTRPDVIVYPLMLLHGWPSCYLEFMDIIPMLTRGDDNVCFNVVVPSLPGYAYSPLPSSEPQSPAQIAAVYHQLMVHLNYPRYVIHGGDWGSIVGRFQTNLYPDSVAALHITFPTFALPPWYKPWKWVKFLTGFALPSLVYTKEEAKLPTNLLKLWEEVGYMFIQATRPQSLGYGLTDSPVGLMAWLLEKYTAWSDCKDEHGQFKPLDVYSKHFFCRLATLYYMTNTATSSMYIYHAFFHKELLGMNTTGIQAPMGMAIFPGEPLKVPREWVENWCNLKRYTVMERGGHFPAVECPQDLAKELLAFVWQLCQENELMS